MPASSLPISSAGQFRFGSVARRAGKAILRDRVAPIFAQAGVTSALRSVRRQLRRSNTGTLLVLAYHRVCERPPEQLRYLSETLAVSPGNFDAQMAYLSRHYRVMPLDLALQRLSEGDPPPGDTVAITFDDGFRDNLTDALPALVRYGLPATLFVATDFIGTGALPWFDRLVPLLRDLDLPRLRRDAGALIPPEIDSLIEIYLSAPIARRRSLINLLSEALKRMSEDRKQAILAALAANASVTSQDLAPPLDETLLMLSWDDLRYMTRAGITIGSHSCSHPILSRVSSIQLERELAGSKIAIETNLDLPCTLFAYPNGQVEDCPTGIGDLLRGLGYEAACANFQGLNESATDRMMVRRMPVGNYPEDVFGLALEYWFAFGERAR